MAADARVSEIVTTERWAQKFQRGQNLDFSETASKMHGIGILLIVLGSAFIAGTIFGCLAFNASHPTMSLTNQRVIYAIMGASGSALAIICFLGSRHIFKQEFQNDPEYAQSRLKDLVRYFYKNEIPDNQRLLAVISKFPECMDLDYVTWKELKKMNNDLPNCAPYYAMKPNKWITAEGLQWFNSDSSIQFNEINKVT